MFYVNFKDGSLGFLNLLHSFFRGDDLQNRKTKLQGPVL